MPSIELITECVAKPLLFVRCDIRCGSFISMAVGDDTPAAVVQFVDSAREQGWMIGLMGNLCPTHAAMGRETEAREAAARDAELLRAMPAGSVLN